MEAKRDCKDLMRNDDGAIMVLGVFMCTFLVGALWYIAGLGDALIYRERMQEGADAVAFSAAIIHARGMNIIVLMNLLMAAILAIRVALKLAQLVLGIAAGILFCLFFVPGAAAAGSACAYGVEVLQNVIDSTRPVINQALQGLSTAENAVKMAIPPAALAAGLEMGTKYSPTISSGVYYGNTLREMGLPLEEGSGSKLCRKAGDAVTGVIREAFKPVPGIGDFIGMIMGFVSDAIGSVPEYFCELGGVGGSHPSFKNANDANVEDSCKHKKQEKCDAYDSARAQYKAVLDKYYPPGVDAGAVKLTASQQAEIDAAKAKVDQTRDPCVDFDMDDCKKETTKEVEKRQKEALEKMKSGEKGSADGKTPKKVKSNWFNGTDDAQLISGVFGNTAKLNYSPKLVEIASFQNRKVGGPPAGSQLAVAQAEFFYDCSGAWEACNSDEEAMWNFRWRARFRLVNLGAVGLDLVQTAEKAFVGKWALDFSRRGVNGISPYPANLAQKAELFKIAGRHVVVH